MSDEHIEHNLISHIRDSFEAGEFEQALEISTRALKTDPVDLEVYDLRWQVIARLFSDEEAKEKIHSDVRASWCGPCNTVIPEVNTVYERFCKTDDVIVLGINDGEKPEQVQKFLDEHNPQWQILLDPFQEVRKSFQIKGIPSFIMIDKEGNWQYSFLGSHIIKGQPLIWMIEELLSDK